MKKRNIRGTRSVDRKIKSNRKANTNPLNNYTRFPSPTLIPLTHSSESRLTFGSNDYDLSGIDELFEGNQRRLLKIAYRPRKKHGNFFRSNARFIAASEASWASRYCFCGIKTATGPGPCENYRFCPHCAYTKGMELCRRFLSSYRAEEFHFVTLSWKGALTFNTENAYQSLFYWDAIGYALKEAKDKGYCTGGLWVEEIALFQFMNTEVNPHVHAIVHGISDLEGFVSFIESELLKYQKTPSLWRENGPQVILSPSIKAKPITSIEMMKRAIQYSVKAVSLKKPYKKAETKLLENNQHDDQWQLRSQMKDFLMGLPLVTRKRRKVRTIGSMFSTSKSYVGRKDYKSKEASALVDSVIAVDWKVLGEEQNDTF